MRIVKDCIITTILSFIFASLLFCSAYADEIEVMTDDVLNLESEVNAYYESESGSSPSESDIVSDPENQPLNNLYVQNLIIQSQEEEAPEEEEEEEIYIFNSENEILAASLPSIPRDNTIIYRGTFANNPCWVMFPGSAADSLIVVDGILVNIGSNTVTGRVFSSDTFDISEVNCNYLVIYSQFSTNIPQSNYTYTYPSYLREYYHNGTRITYADTYGNFNVIELTRTNDNTLEYKIFICVFVCLLFVGTGYILSFFRIGKR